MRKLVERAQRGDHEAFSRLLADQAGRLYATAYLMLRDRPSAEDAVQDACLKAWRDIPSLRNPDRYDAWLRRLLVRACLDQVRRRRRRPSEVSLSPEHAAAISDVSERMASVDQLEHAFSRLSVDHRAVVVLSHFDGLPMSDIAETLGIPVGTVKSRLHHALRAMRGAIEADDRRSSDARGETA